MRLPGRYKAFPLFLPCLRLLPDIFKVVIKEKSQPHVWVFFGLTFNAIVQLDCIMHTSKINLIFHCMSAFFGMFVLGHIPVCFFLVF